MTLLLEEFEFQALLTAFQRVCSLFLRENPSRCEPLSIWASVPHEKVLISIFFLQLFCRLLSVIQLGHTVWFFLGFFFLFGKTDSYFGCEPLIGNTMFLSFFSLSSKVFSSHDNECIW